MKSDKARAVTAKQSDNGSLNRNPQMYADGKKKTGLTQKASKTAVRY